jgi:hypothetical protein
MAFRIKGATVVNDNREITVDGITATANDRVFVGVTATGTTPLSPSIFQGSVSGYTSGGISTANDNTIDKFPFSSDTNATDVGDLAVATRHASGQSSTTHGYHSAGFISPSFPSGSLSIQKFSFSNDDNATSIGNLIRLLGTRYLLTGHSSQTNGYASGGTTAPPGTTVNNIDKFPFSVDSNATDVGDLSSVRYGVAGQSSATHGYTCGGYNSAPLKETNTIDKFPFVSDTNATDIGDLSQARNNSSGQSSTTHGYTSGGIKDSPPATVYNTIDKFPFSSDSNATDVGDLTGVRNMIAGQSSTVSGYSSGGITSSPPNLNVIDKFPFATDTNATDIGDLTVARDGSAGQQARTIQ